jgi:hypothetical protein
MAEDTLNFAIHNKMLAPAACITDTVTLHGATTHAGTSNPYLREYGTDLDGIRSLIIEEPSLRSPIDASLPYCFAQVVYAIRYEMARSLEDVLSRRTRALLLDSQAALRAAPEVARILSRELRMGGRSAPAVHPTRRKRLFAVRQYLRSRTASHRGCAAVQRTGTENSALISGAIAASSCSDNRHLGVSQTQKNLFVSTRTGELGKRNIIMCTN